MQPAIDAVANLLSRDGNEDKSAEELATEIVDGIFGAIRRGFKEPVPPLEVGLVYSFAWLPNPMSLVWEGDGWRWFVSKYSEYGYLTPDSELHPRLRYRRLSRGAFVAPADDRYIVGDWVQLAGAKAHRYKVVAAAGTIALLEGPKGTYTAFPFAELDKRFRHWRKRERTSSA